MDKRTGIVLVLATAIISGVSIFLNSYAVSGFDSSVFTFAKNVLVAFALAAVVLVTRIDLRGIPARSWLLLALVGLIGGAAPFLLFFHGLSLVSGAAAGFIHKTLFVFVAVFAYFFLRERFSPLMIVGAALILTGTVLSIRGSLIFEAAHLFILGATVLWALENVLSKHITKDLPGRLVAFGRMGFGSLFLFLFVIATGRGPLLVSMSASQYAWIALTSVLLLGYVLTYYEGLARIRVSTAAALLSLGAPVTALLSFAAGTASFDAFGIFSFMLIAAGSALIIARELPLRVSA
jgi:drug/metabolite transporter (DMT)-like permease